MGLIKKFKRLRQRRKNLDNLRFMANHLRERGLEKSALFYDRLIASAEKQK